MINLDEFDCDSDGDSDTASSKLLGDEAVKKSKDQKVKIRDGRQAKFQSAITYVRNEFPKIRRKSQSYRISR